jgi:hypothetical protein
MCKLFLYQAQRIIKTLCWTGGSHSANRCPNSQEPCPVQHQVFNGQLLGANAHKLFELQHEYSDEVMRIDIEVLFMQNDVT